MDEVKQDILNSVIVSCSPKTDGELAGENYFFQRFFLSFFFAFILCKAKIHTFAFYVTKTVLVGPNVIHFGRDQIIKVRPKPFWTDQNSFGHIEGLT